MAMRGIASRRSTPPESLGQPPFRSPGRTAGGRREALTMPRIACGPPSARRIAHAISMGHYQRSLVLVSCAFSSRSEDEATRKNVILNPFTPYDVLSELENQFTELFVNNPALESYNSMKL